MGVCERDRHAQTGRERGRQKELTLPEPSVHFSVKCASKCPLMFVHSDVNWVSVTTKRAPQITDKITILIFHVKELSSGKLQSMLKSPQLVRGPPPV